MNRAASSLLAFALAAAAGLAAAAAPPPEPTPKPLVSSVEVSVTSIDAVVVDSKGNRVRGLTKEDFVVLEDGKVQDLSNFLFVDDTESVPAGEAAPAPPRPEPGVLTPAVSKPQARVVVFIDNLHIPPVNRNAVLTALDGFLRKAVGPNVEAMIVTFDRSLRVRGPFTRDAEILSRVLVQVANESTAGAGRISERNQLFHQIDEAAGTRDQTGSLRDLLFDQATAATRSFSDSEKYDADATINGLEVTLGRLAGVDGRKILILVSEKLPEFPGQEVWDYLRNARRAAGLDENGAGMPPIFEYDETKAFQNLATAANAALVSLYTFDAQGLGFDPSISSERAGTLGIQNPGPSTVSSDAMMQLLASETGGLAAIQRNGFGAVLAEMEQDWRVYYSLGYSTPPKAANKPRKIEVRVKPRGLSVRSRTAVLERSADERLAEQVTSGLFFPRYLNPLDAAIDRGRVVAGPKKTFVLPLTIRVPYAKLTLVPDGGRLKGGLVFTVAVKAPDGRYTKADVKTIPIDVPEKEVVSGAVKEFVHHATFQVRPGLQVFSLGLTDAISRQTTFAQPEFNLAAREEPASR
jgi:VWFA-related protein